jgi:hypothetical protein
MNPNALYELGVRHALRPYTTIVLCEDRVTKYPFDISHNVVMTYHHLGEGIDYDEVLRVQNELQRKIDGVLARPVRSCCGQKRPRRNRARPAPHRMMQPADADSESPIASRRSTAALAGRRPRAGSQTAISALRM